MTPTVQARRQVGESRQVKGASMRSTGRRPADILLVTVGLGALVLTSIGLSGVGDAPDPHAGAGVIAAWFADRRGDVLLAAPFVVLGLNWINVNEEGGPPIRVPVVLMLAFIAALAVLLRDEHRVSQPVPAAVAR